MKHKGGILLDSRVRRHIWVSSDQRKETNNLLIWTARPFSAERTQSKHLDVFLAGRANSPFPQSLCPVLVVQFFSSMYTEWVTPRRFHCRVNWAETPIHQTGLCVLSLFTHKMQKRGKNVSYFSSVWASLHAPIPFRGPPISHTEAAGGRQDPSRINTKSFNGAWGGETLTQNAEIPA